MLRTADLLSPKGHCHDASPVGSPLAAVVSYRGGLVPPRTGPSPVGGSRLFIWTHSRVVEILPGHSVEMSYAAAPSVFVA